MFNKTVDSITKVFTQAIKDLAALESTKLNQISNNNNIIIQKMNDDSAAAEAEIKRSQAVRTKLQSIVQ